MSGNPFSGPRRVRISPNTEIHSGRMLRVTNPERRELEEAAQQMTRVAFYARPGWLAEYVMAHNRVSQILSGAISRAHMG